MFKKLLIFFFFLQGFSFAQNIPPRPNPPRLVNDFVGGLLSQDQIAQLEDKLVAYNDSTSTQVAIVIVKTVKPYDISDYAFKLGRQWGIGQKGKNNGVLILWAPGDRKIFIATGYGAEGAITDAYSKRIIEQIIKPNFKQLRYFEGLSQASDGIFKGLAGEYDAEPSTEMEGDPLFTILVFLLLFLIIMYLIRKSGGGNNGRRGGGFFPYTTYTGWGSSSGGWSSGGSDWGGGGGFGGFGGGDFGGGGAGGDY